MLKIRENNPDAMMAATQFWRQPPLHRLCFLRRFKRIPLHLVKIRFFF